MGRIILFTVGFPLYLAPFMKEFLKQRFSGRKIQIGIACGGRSAEHQISLISAKNVINALDPELYETTIIGITAKGQWLLMDPSEWIENGDNPALVKLGKALGEIALTPGSTTHKLAVLKDGVLNSLPNPDVIFPVLHGPFAEDGTVQGLLKLLDIPFVGPSVLGSAVSMDKDVMKRLLKEANIPTPRFLVFNSSEANEIDYETIKAQLGSPLFIKPANMGSSIGISKASSLTEFNRAVEFAFKFDSKVIIEESVKGREIECAILGNEIPNASAAGEIIPKAEFYSYEAKYISEDGAALEAPAKLSSEALAKIQRMAIKTFKVLCCEGLSMVDFFLKEDGELLVNEINTIPGFTKISMYPRLWGLSGVGYSELIDRLVNLALSRFDRESALLTEMPKDC